MSTKLFKIKPETNPYEGVNLEKMHTYLGENTNPARRGRLTLNVRHNNGMDTDLTFLETEVEEVTK